jgi:hypothetical protein
MRANRSIRSRAAHQRGISFIGLVFVAAVLGCLGVVIDKAANKAREGTTVPEVRAIFDRAQAIDDFKSVSGKDLDIKKVGDKVVVSYAYEREIPLFGPAFLVLKYKGETR